MKVDLELEKRIGSGKLRIIVIKPKFIDISLGMNFTFKNKTEYNLWNMQINIFFIEHIISILFNNPIKKKISLRGQENIDYIMKD